MRHLFGKESHYFCAASIFVCGYVFFMHFLFHAGWVDSNMVLRFIADMERVVPAIRRLHDDPTEYTNYWGIFFALFWITAPIYWLLGFLGASHLNAYRRQKYVIETTDIRVWCILLLGTLGVGFVFTFPVLNGMCFVRQTSDIFPVLMLSWWITAGIIYAQAQACRVLLIKLGRK